MRYVDLSHPIVEETPLYPGTPAFRKKRVKVLGRDSCNTFYISFSNHCGTHIDGPRHFLSSGSRMSDFDLADFIFVNPYIAELRKTADEPITSSDLAGSCRGPGRYDCIIIKTGFGKYRGKDSDIYVSRNPYLLPEAARFIKEKLPTVRAIAIDAISIGSCMHKELGRQAHRILLKEDGPGRKPVFIIEDLNISYRVNRLDGLSVFPMIMGDIDSSPCRVLGVVDD